MNITKILLPTTEVNLKVGDEVKAVKIISTSIRLTVDDYLTLKRKAQKARMTLSAYVLRACFGPTTKQHKYWRKPHA